MALDLRVRSALDALGLEPEVVPCEDALADTAAFCAHYGYSESISANCIVVVGKSESPVYAACMVLATTRLDVNQTIRRRFGTKRASFASGEQTTALTGMTIGGVTPFGLPAGLPLWIDARVMACPRIIVGGGSRTAKLLLPPADLLRIAGAEVIEGLAKDLPPPES